MNQLLANLDHYSQPNNQQTNYVLAVITATKGSTYRKAGAMMLINQTGQSWGLLSGGCLEADIIAHASDVFANQQDKWISYDMRGDPDLVWGLGLGCDGEVHILLKYLPAGEPFIEALSAIDKGEPQLMLVKLTQGLSQEQSQLKLLPLTSPNGSVEFENHTITATDKPQQHNIGEHNWLAITLKPTFRILICGGAPDVPPVVNIAHQLGWQVTVIDHRPDYVKPERFNNARNVLRVKRSQWQDFDLSYFDAVVIMSHQYERDQQYLSKILDSGIPYVGILGPQQRRDKLLNDCNTTIAAHQGRVFGPVGLKLGAQTPEGIALSIVSEIQAVLTNCNGGIHSNGENDQ
jgi:xanthine dehydrogenase accessory factor